MRLFRARPHATKFGDVPLIVKTVDGLAEKNKVRQNLVIA